MPQLKDYIPKSARGPIKAALYFGLSRQCPCCGARLRRFVPFGLISRANAKCPVCWSLERHRMMHQFFLNETDLYDGRPKKLLHIAPEAALEPLLRRAPNVDYLSADLDSPRAMVSMDITDIQYPDNTFDVVYCSHVLEHVPDDLRAMTEFHRVLKPGGWAILQVPLSTTRTYEDASVTDPQDREALFGQWDHVRRYGPDYADRLRKAGFEVDVRHFVESLDPHTVRRYGLAPGDPIHYCVKGSLAAASDQRRSPREEALP